jgi:hypothetical protein
MKKCASLKSLKKGVGSGSAPKCHGSPTFKYHMDLQKYANFLSNWSYLSIDTRMRRSVCASRSGEMTPMWPDTDPHNSDRNLGR